MQVLRGWRNKKVDKRIIGMLLLGWGLLSAFILVYPYRNTMGTGWVMEIRCNRLTDMYHALLQDGKFAFDKVGHSMAYPLYYPYIMKLFNIQDGRVMFMRAQTAYGMVAMLIYPLLIYKISNSVVVALISPFVVHFTFGDLLYINKCDEYYGGLWAAAIAIPLLYLYRSEESRRKRGVLLGGIALAISCSNILRNASGLPLLIVALFILFEGLVKKRRRIRSILISAAILVCTSNLLSSAIPGYVADKWGVAGKAKYNSSPWFAIMLGMGYLENDYGLYWSDDSGRALIKELYPDVVYNSDEFYECCKEVALQIIKDDPLFVVKGWFLKLGRCISMQADYLSGKSIRNRYSYEWIFIGIAVEALLLIKIKRIREYAAKYLSLLVTGAGITLLSMYSGVLAVPDEYYILGAIGGAGIVVVFLFLTMSAMIIQELAKQRAGVPKQDKNAVDVKCS